MRIFFSRYSLEYLQEADSFRKKKQKTHGLCLWATPICTTRVQIRTCTSRTPPEPHTNRGSQAGPAPFVLDVVGDHTHTHSPRTQSTRQHKPCPLEAAAARVEGARRCCVLAAAGPIACGVCVFASKKSNEVSPPREPQPAPAQKLDRSRFFRSTIRPRKSHIRQ